VIGGVPAGAIMSFAMNSPPSGWVICNGAEYAIADYGDLHTAIGTTWGALTNGSGGAGSTHFRVPDLRGEFLRGVDSGRGLDSNRVFASTVSDNVKQFQGWVEAPAYADYSSCFKAADGTIFTLSTQVTYGPSYDSNAAQGPRYTRATMTIGSGSETYPKNVAILYCIKY
jgi:microcystin-dependent protein